MNKDTPLGPLPEHWDVVRLGEVANFESGKRMKGGGREYGEVLSIGGEHIGDFGQLVILKPQYISNEFYQKMVKGKLENDDVLICKDGAKTGKVAYLKEKLTKCMAVNEHVFIIRSKDKNTLLNKFLFFFYFRALGKIKLKLLFTV